MKKKIVINVPMHCDKAKSKAMKIAVAIQGVISVSVGATDKLEVVGEEVDSVCLANCLRKKFCFAEIISVGEVKPPPPPPPPPPPCQPPPPPPPCPPPRPPCQPPPCQPPPPPPCQPPPSCHPLYYECVYDPPLPNCSIM